MALPTSAFDSTKSVFASRSRISFTKTGAGSPVVFEAGKLDDESGAPEEKKIELPDDTGVMRPVRRMVTAQPESWSFVMYEVKRLLDLFSGALSGRVTGAVTLWIPDPDDATGKCALKSEDFDCTITRGGNVSFGGDFSSATIKISSDKQGAVSWTADATIPA